MLQKLPAKHSNMQRRHELPAVNLLRPSYNDLAVECGSRALPITVRKNKDIIIAGSGHALLYLNHDGWLFR
jgi:hypothetical protein